MQRWGPLPPPLLLLFFFSVLSSHSFLFSSNLPFFCSSPPLISFLLPPSRLPPPPRPLSVFFISRRGAAVTGCRSRRHGNAWRCVRLWKHFVSCLEGAGGREWILHTIACCSLVSGWRGSHNQILYSEDADLLLCHHIEKSVFIFSLNSLHDSLGLHIFRLCLHNNMK